MDSSVYQTIISYLFSSIVFLLILGIVVLIHELGHFVAAKMIGAKVEEFAFGFGPSIWKKQYGETLYKWNIYPLGGYCKILGESEDVADDPRSFSTKSPLQRIFVLVAGVFMNFVLAVIVFTIFFSLNSWKMQLLTSPDLPDYRFAGAVARFLIEKTNENLPAAKAGVPEKTYIKSINSVDIKSYRNLVDETKKNFNTTIDLGIVDSEGKNLKIYKVFLDAKSDTGNPIIGVSLNYYIDYSNVKVLSGYYHAYDTVIYNVLGLQHVYSKSVEEGNLNYASESTGSIAKIAQITHRMVLNDNWLGILYWIGLISASLSFMNLLPVLPLDGGHIFFILLEAILRRKISDSLKAKFAFGGLIFFILLFVVLFVKDIREFTIIKNFLAIFGIK
jgi:regulator of sigma E protease